MHVSSSAFSEGAEIPRQFTCDGENVSPPLEWSGAPEETLSFVLLCDDPDAPSGTWHHWAAYDIPSDTTSLATGAAKEAIGTGFKQATNDFQRTGYGGPCPPHGHGTHHYRFRVLALSVEQLPVVRSASCRDVEREAAQHVLAEAVLVGVYER